MPRGGKHLLKYKNKCMSKKQLEKIERLKDGSGKGIRD